MPSDEQQVRSMFLPPPGRNHVSTTAALPVAPLSEGRNGLGWGANENKQFECVQDAQIMILDHTAPNPLFPAQVGDSVQNILDTGKVDGTWAREADDKFPGAGVPSDKTNPRTTE